MYTDPFDFITTRTEPRVSQISIRDTLNLLPLVSADIRQNSLDPKGLNNTNPNNLFEGLAKAVEQLPDNLPAYQYTTQQERRYSNPNLQYTPYNILGTDTEDVYGRFQSKWDQLGNSLLKTGANALGTFVSSFATIPETLDLVRSGKAIEAFGEDRVFSDIQNWLIALEDKLPNYYTEWEREHPYLSAIPFSGGSVNFWGDKVLKNIGFSIGALGAGIVQDSLIELATAGTASPVTFIAAANQLNKFKSNLFRGFRQFTKGANHIDEVLDASKLSGLAEGLKISNLAKVTTGARFAGLSYMGAQGESFIEGYHTYLDTKKQLLEEAIKSGNDNPETFAKIEQLSQDAARYTTGLNLPILLVSNLIQFPNLLYGKNLLGKSIGKEFIKTELTDTGLKYVSDFSLKKGVKQWAKETLKDVIPEGLEEGSQFHISNSLHDYYVDRLNPEIKESLAEYVLKSVPDSLANKQFWEESFLGALSGGLMGAPANIKNITSGKQRYEEVASHLNNSLERFNSAVKQFSIGINLTNKNANSEITKHDALFSTVHDSLKYGTFDTFIDSLEDLKGLSVEEYNKTFLTEFETNLEKNEHLDSMILESYQLKADVEKVNKVFTNNPYTKSKLTKKILSAFSPKNQVELDNIQESLFNDFREVVARNESLLRKTNGKVLLHKDNLKALGVKNESIDYIANLAQTKKGLKSYLDFKQAQINDLKTQVEYYEELSKADTPLLDSSVKPKSELKKAKKVLKDTQDFYDRIQTIKDNDKLRDEILYEETTEEQRDRYIEERKKQMEELLAKQQESNSLETEKEDLHSEESKSAEEILDLNVAQQESGEILIEKEPVPEPVVDENQWLENYNPDDEITSDGNTYTVIGKTDDSLIAQDDLGVRYELVRKNNNWQIKSLGPEGVAQSLQEEIPKDHARKVIEKYLNQLRETSNPIEQLNAINSILSNIELAPDSISQEELSEVLSIQDNLKSQGYEIVNLLGRKFDPGPKLTIVNSVLDESLPPGSEIITKVKKPQINKNGVMIQAADVWVTVGPEQLEQLEQQTEEVLKEYTAPVTAETKTQTKKEVLELQLSEQEFTPQQVWNFPNTVWIKSTEGLNNGTVVYSVETKDGETIVRRRKIVGTRDLRIGEASKIIATTLDEFINSNFLKDAKLKQVLRNGESVVSLEEKPKDNKLEEFLGEYSYLKDTFQTQIDRGKFKLIC